MAYPKAHGPLKAYSPSQGRDPRLSPLWIDMLAPKITTFAGKNEKAASHREGHKTLGRLKNTLNFGPLRHCAPTRATSSESQRAWRERKKDHDLFYHI